MSTNNTGDPDMHPEPLAIASESLLAQLGITKTTGAPWNFQVQFATVLGYDYSLQSATNLTSPIPWADVARRTGTNFPATISVTDSNVAGQNFYRLARKGLPEPPFIVAQPLSVKRPLGSDASFHARIGGVSPLSCYWQKDGALLSLVPLVDGPRDKVTLTLTNVQLADGAGYALVVTNASGSVTSAVATLTVAPPGTNRITAGKLTSGGFAMQFEGDAGSGWWVLRSTSLPRPWTGTGTVTLAADGTGSFLDANPPLGQAFYRLSATAPQPPVITLHPVPQNKRVGETATFSVGASGAEPLAYQWRKAGTDIAGATSNSLSVTNVQITDAANYDAVVANLFGSATSAVPTLTVLSSAAPAPAMDFDAPGSLYTDASYSMGFEFDVLQLITVTALGIFDDDMNGFAESHDVGIFNTNGALLASATVLSTNQLIGYLRYQQIPPVNLAAASGYRVAAVTATERFTRQPSGTTTNALIRFVRDRYTSYATELVLPTRTDGLVGYFGANFLLTPSTPPSSPVWITIEKPTVSSTWVGLNFVGSTNSNWTVERATQVQGPWTNIGSFLTDPSGVGSFQDTNPPSSRSFYRAIEP